MIHMTRSSTRATLVVLAIAFGLAALPGCAPSRPTTPPQVATAFARALIEGDGETACALSADQQGPMSKDRDGDWTQCVQTVAGLKAWMQVASLKPERIEVATATISGDTANVAAEDYSASTPQEERIELELKRVDGRWYVSSLPW